MRTTILIGVIVIGLILYFAFLKPIDKGGDPDRDYSADKAPAAFEPNPTPSPAGTRTYANQTAKYSFAYTDEWEAATKNVDAKSALFGPDATATSGDGGVDLIGTLQTGQTLEDFVKTFNAGVQSGSTSETPAEINGQHVVISILPGPGLNSEVKAVAFQNDAKQVFNVYINYHTDGTDKINLLKNFDDLTSTFHFLQQ